MLRFAKGTKVVLQLGEICFQNAKRLHVHHKSRVTDSPSNLCGRANIIFRNTTKLSTSISKEEDGAVKQPDEETLSTSTDQDEVIALDEATIAEITEGDAELEHRLKVIMLEVDVMRQEGKAIPSIGYMKTEFWKELLEKQSYSGRKRYLEYLFKVEKKRENRKNKQKIRQLEMAGPRPEKPDNELNYDLGHNHIFLRFYDTTMNHLDNNRLIQAMQFGQKLVVDCGFHENMNKPENANCAKQLMLAFSENRLHRDPFDLHLCNFEPEGMLMHYLQKHVPTLHEPWFPLNIHQKSYLDIFPKEKLIYLTPHCRDVMNTYDNDAIYIIGGIVDKSNNEPLTLAKAKKEGIRMVKFPLDHYLEWGSGSGKTLTINHIVSILLDLKLTGDWNYALRHIPRRKLAHYQLTVAAAKLDRNLRSQEHIVNLARKFRDPRNNFPKGRNATARLAGKIVSGKV